MGCSGLLVSGCMALSAFSLHHILLLGFFSLTALSVDVVGLLLRFTFLCRYVQLFVSQWLLDSFFLYHYLSLSSDHVLCNLI